MPTRVLFASLLLLPLLLILLVRVLDINGLTTLKPDVSGSSGTFDGMTSLEVL